MRFLVDESAGSSVVVLLRQAGHDVVAVSELMPSVDDTTILAAAAHESRIVVTNDKDFGELVHRQGLAHAGVVLLRLQDESTANRQRVMQSVLDQMGDQLPGKFVVATETQLRIRSS